MKKNVLKNYFYNLTYQLLLIILPIVTTPYLARTLGANGTGIYSYTISITTYFILLGTLGIAMYGQREIAYNQENEKRKSCLFWELVIFKIISMSFSMILFYFNFAKSGEYALYYKILLIEMIANCLDISWFYQGIEEFKKIAIRNIVIKLCSVISIFIFVKTPNDIGKYLIIYVLSSFLGSLMLWINIKKYIAKVKLRDLNIKKHLKSILILFVPQVAMHIYTVLDKTMIGAITNDMSEVGYYEQTQKIIKILLTVITSMGTVMLPRIANLFSDGNKDKIRKYMNYTFNFVFLISIPLAFGLIAISNNFVPLFFGDGYDKVILIMKIMSPIILFIGLSNIIGNQYLISTRRQKVYTISIICGAFINFILNTILIKRYLSYGAAIATVIAEMSVTFIQLFGIRKEFKIKNILKLAKNNIIAALVMFIVCLLLHEVFKQTIVCISIQIICGFIIYFSILILLKDKFLIEILKKILNEKFLLK